jgi:hypothetical protein
MLYLVYIATTKSGTGIPSEVAIGTDCDTTVW